jgi:hypothetical protein
LICDLTIDGDNNAVKCRQQYRQFLLFFMAAALWWQGSRARADEQAPGAIVSLYPLGISEAVDRASSGLFPLSWSCLLLYLKSAIKSLFSFIVYKKSFDCTVCNGLRFGDKRLRFIANIAYLVDDSVACGILSDGTSYYEYKGRRQPHPSVSDWQRSARKGCHLCQLVLNGVRAIYPEWLESEKDKHILAAAVPEGPLQVLLTDCNFQIDIYRERRIEIFVQGKTRLSCY